MKEVCVRFGTTRHLVGTTTMPSAPQSTTPLAFVLLNAGVIHRIGPHRLNVKLARQLAQVGFPSLRFDLTAQGDSVSPLGAAPYEKQAVSDIRAAMDHFERLTGIRHFVVAGICSGADHGLATAVEDSRVVGLWMMDGYAYPTSKTRRMRYLRRLEERSAPEVVGWAMRKLLALCKRAPNRKATDAGDSDPARYSRSIPTSTAYADALQTLVDREAKVFLMYSGSVLERFNYQGQLRDAFRSHRFVEHVRCDYAPHIDHSVTTLAAQSELIATICSWAREIRLPNTRSAAIQA